MVSLYIGAMFDVLIRLFSHFLSIKKHRSSNFSWIYCVKAIETRNIKQFQVRGPQMRLLDSSTEL
jgi:hypothetical protein